jgi:hypothetical protein
MAREEAKSQAAAGEQMAGGIDPIRVLSFIVNVGLPLLAKKRNPRDPAVEFNRLYGMFLEKFGPVIVQMQMEALRSGQAAGQNLAADIGAAGGGATGAGAQAATIGATLGSARAGRALLEGHKLAADYAAQLLPSALGREVPTTRFQDVIGALGRIRTATRRDPIDEIIRAGVSLFQKPENQAPQGQTSYGQQSPFTQLPGAPRRSDRDVGR